jgi:flagellar M-ring protein FliF
MDNAAVIPANAPPDRADTIQARLARLSPRARATLAVGTAALIALIASAWLWSSSPTYRILFTNLSDQDGGAIIAQLSQMTIPYQNGDGGTILVPADRVHEARLKLAAQGLPKGSLVGFELLENQRFGVTQFQEQINYQRGLEGELAKSIQSLSPVVAARVHLALPKQSGFLRDRQPPSASVLLQLRAGQSLDRSQVGGIVHLVSASVPELNPKNVSVVDQYGNLLANQSETAAGLDANQLDYVNQIQAAAIKRIEDILEPIVGRGNVRAQVTADIDFSQVEQMAETYKPNQGADTGAMRSHTSSESSQPGPASPAGVPGATSNQPPVPPTAPINGQAAPLNPGAAGAQSGNSVRRDQTTNYEVDKNVRQVKSPSGQIRRLSAAVVVNQRLTLPAPGSTDKPQSSPLSQKEMDDINALVREAMGFNKDRGDSVNVVNAPFSQPEFASPEVLPLWKQPDAIALGREVGKAMLFLLLALIVVFGAVRPALRSLTAREVVDGKAGDDEDDGEASAAAIAARGAPPALAAPEAQSPSPIESVRLLAKSDPASVANVVKAWVGEGK